MTAPGGIANSFCYSITILSWCKITFSCEHKYQFETTFRCKNTKFGLFLACGLLGVRIYHSEIKQFTCRTLREISGFTNQSFFVKIIFTKNVKVVITIMVVAVILWKSVYSNCKERYWDHNSGRPSGRNLINVFGVTALMYLKYRKSCGYRNQSPS